jgi:hypothetical protein
MNIYFTRCEGYQTVEDRHVDHSAEKAEFLFVEAAYRLGYTAVRFDGYESRSTAEARKNRRLLDEVQLSFPYDTYGIVAHCYKETPARPLMAEEEALAVARASLGDYGCDL